MDDGSLIGGGGGSGYSKLSTKSPDLLNDLVWFFPGPSQKQLIVLFHGCHGQFLVSNKRPELDIWKKSLLNDQHYLFFQILEA